MSKDIGERVISVRKKAGLNQREFAARLGISNGGISQIENGKAMPRRGVSVKDASRV